MTARHHHYLSQCYLKGFTDKGNKKSKLTVIDVSELKYFKTTPRNVGGIRDFNKVEFDGIEVDALEKDLANFEGQAATAIKRLRESQAFEGETRDTILNLIALLSVRSPQMREHFGNYQKQILEQMLDLSLATEERWESQMDQMRKDGHKLSDDITYEDIKEFHGKKQYQINIRREFHIAMELKMIKNIVPVLGSRDWALFRVNAESGPFICNDNPVHLAWIDPESVPPFFRQSPGFGLGGTRVYFPISKELALVGEFDGKEGTFDASRDLVTVLNSGLLTRTYKQIYAPSLNFEMFWKDGSRLTGAEFLKALRA